ncbi:hypothetical protein EWB00_008891 [Schistosoma japonicum]|uniref:Uncharacterized protein n=1 Tax=Schistosoma japonicum TaxID=6182 RepID=A0A4Z2DSI0_SCHJA|nr:hypothetical protein EWB00_008891 [Schistosoma japonicum]
MKMKSAVHVIINLAFTIDDTAAAIILFIKANETLIEIVYKENELKTKFLFVVFFITMNLLCSHAAGDTGKTELEQIKKTPEYQQVREKVINTLADKIDNYVLDQIRKKNQ